MNKNPIIKIPDELYELAFQFRKAKPWDKLCEAEMFAVKHSDGTIGYCCITGMLGEHFALINYHGMKGLASYRGLTEYREEGIPVFALNEQNASQDGIMLSFENKEYCHPDTIAMVKDYCKRAHKTLRGANAYPNFQKLQPGFYPWPITEKRNLVYIEEALCAAMEVIAGLKEKNAFQLGFSDDIPYDRDIPLLEKTENGYRWSAISLPETEKTADPIGELKDETKIAQLKKAKKNRHAWVAYIYMGLQAVAEEECAPGEIPDTPPFYPYYLIVADEHSREPVCVAISATLDQFNDSFIDPLFQAVLQYGQPKVLHFIDRRTEAYMTGIADILGWKTEFEEDSEVLEELMDDFLNADSENPGIEEMIDQLISILSSPEEVRLLPDEALLEMKAPLKSNLFSDDIASVLTDEFKRRGLYN